MLVDRETAATQLRHASVATTRRYSRDDLRKAKKASVALAARLSLALLDDFVRPLPELGLGRADSVSRVGS